MSFGGHVQAMINSIKNNARPKKRLFDSKEFGGKGVSEGWKKVLEQKATYEQLQEIRLRIREENRNDLMKKMIAVVITLFITVILAVIIFSLVGE